MVPVVVRVEDVAGCQTQLTQALRHGLGLRGVYDRHLAGRLLQDPDIVVLPHKLSSFTIVALWYQGHEPDGARLGRWRQACSSRRTERHGMRCTVSRLCSGIAALVAKVGDAIRLCERSC